MKKLCNEVLTRFYPSLVVCLILLLVLGCGGGNGGYGGVGGDVQIPIDSVTATVSPEEGGILVLADGSSLDIPPDALFEPTTITISAIMTNDESDSLLGGLILNPKGLVLKRPATVSVYLPEGWSEDDWPSVYVTKSDDLSDLVPRGDLADIIVTSDGVIAEAQIYGFSAVAFARNCHAGSIRRVVENFESRGCSLKTVISQVNQKFPSVVFDHRITGSATPPQVQAFLDTYFDDIGSWDPGKPVDTTIWASVLQAAQAGRQVVLAFSQRPWDPRGGPNNFLPSGPYAHTANLQISGNKIEIHNTMATGNTRLRAHFGGGEVWYTWNAEDLEGFRALQNGVALEIQICGKEDCLSSESKNDYGLDVYKPLRGYEWTQYEHWVVAEPGPRPVAFPAVRIYIEKKRADENPCEIDEPPPPVDLPNLTAAGFRLEKLSVTMRLPDGQLGEAVQTPTSSFCRGSIWNEGSMVGNGFETSWENMSIGTHGTISGDMLISLDPATLEITQFRVTDNCQHNNLGSSTFSMKSKQGKVMRPLERSPSNPSLLASVVVGTAVCDYLDRNNLSWEWRPRGGGLRVLENFHCTKDTVLWINAVPE